MIYDSATGKYVSDSIRIAEYLDAQYPQTPSVFPSSTGGLIQAFAEATRSYLTPPAREFLIWTIFVKLNPPSAAYFRDQTERTMGKKMEDLVPENEAKARMEALEGFLGRISVLYSKNGGKGPYMMGEVLSWADIIVASFLMCFRVSAEEGSTRWAEIMSWHSGRWQNLMNGMKKYE